MLPVWYGARTASIAHAQQIVTTLGYFAEDGIGYSQMTFAATARERTKRMAK